MAKGAFYAVALGRSPGIYESWAQAEAQVKGFAGARYKKFPTQAEAQAFVASNSINTVSPSVRAKRSFDAVAAAEPIAKRVHHEGRPIAVQPARPIVQQQQQPSVSLSAGSIARPARPMQQSSASSSSGFYYAVAEGRSTGVVTTWDEVMKRTEGVKNPVYRKFSSQEAAHAYLDGYTSGTRQSPSSADRSHGQQTLGDSNSTPLWWYAVASGRQMGVFDSWAEVKPHIEGLFSACYKKFPSREEAEAFVNQHQPLKIQSTSDPDPKHPDTLVAFCDGSALKNGRVGCKAGFACIFPHQTAWDVAKKLDEPRATNNRAEYFAALEAMKRANIEDPNAARVLYIFSDSMLLIRSMTEWIAGWQKRNWVKADGEPVKNRDVLELLLHEQGRRRIIWRHVKAHTGKKDWHSKWNDVVDQAARGAAES